MTWLADTQKNRPSVEQAQKLKNEREEIVGKLKLMQLKNGTHRSIAAANFHMEDMQKLARRITAIDRRLGRV